MREHNGCFCALRLRVSRARTRMSPLLSAGSVGGQPQIAVMISGPASRRPRSYFRAEQDCRLRQLNQGKTAMATWGDEEILPPGSGDESFEAVVARVHAVLLL
jgi:hypothetical protein